MDEEEYQDAIEEAQDLAEDQADLSESQIDANYPIGKEQSNLYNFFWKVVRNKDSTKTANITHDEIGGAWMQVRNSKQMAILCNTFHHPGLANFFINSAENVLATSMSRKGWLMETAISTKQYKQKSKSSGTGGNSNPSNKWRIFQRKQQQNTTPGG